MIRSLPVQADRPVFGLTRRGVIGLMMGAAVMFTAIVLLVVALFGLHDQGVQLRDQAKKLGKLGHENRTLIAGVANEVSQERTRARAARDAYCRLKHYEMLSGGAVLRIAASFHLLSPRAQARWRLALEHVEQIPAARSCSGPPVGLKASRGGKARPDLVQIGEALVVLPGMERAERPLAARRRTSVPAPAPTPAPRRPRPSAAPQAAAQAPSLAPASSPSPRPVPSPPPAPSPVPSIEPPSIEPKLPPGVCSKPVVAEHNLLCHGQ